MRHALRIRGVSKRYRIGGSRPSDSLRATITNAVKRPWTLFQKARPDSESDCFWALKDVSFDVQKGEALAVVGRNGAGKSTLLKILSRITAPTCGEVEVYGSVASLLEVGTGFHPELTGRENIFLNGSILGMPRKTISRNLDEIIHFAGIEKFIDTPVKHYSSGMYVRLAFAVAAHLDSEILLLDEVLAVGDIAFQKKCLAKMDDIASRGRTVIFVSHNLAAVRQFCPRAVLIDAGQVVADGLTPAVLKQFVSRLRDTTIDANAHIKERSDAMSGAVRFTSFRVEDANGKECYEFHTGDTIRIHVTYLVREPIEDLLFFFAFMSETTGESVTSAKYVLSDKPKKAGETGEAIVEFPNVQLLPHDYLPYVWLGSCLGLPHDRLDYRLTSCPPITVSPRETSAEKEADGYFMIPSKLLAS